MGDEIVNRTVRKIALGSDWWDLIDDSSSVDFVDVITEMRAHEGVVYVAFGAAMIDANNDGVVRISNRLRMTLDRAQVLYAALGDTITKALDPSNKEKPN